MGAASSTPAPPGTKAVYVDLCKRAMFFASKGVGKEHGFTDLQNISKIKTALEADFGAYLGAGNTKECLAGFEEGVSTRMWSDRAKR